MVRTLINRRKSLIFLLACSSLLSVALSFARIFRTHEITLGFMMWNLILAVIPFGLSLLADQMNDELLLNSRKYQTRFILLLLIWLAFFPNAPYMVTDLFHLHQRPGIPLWYDLMLFTSYAWNGLILGFVSLIFFHQKVRLLAGKMMGWIFAISCLGMSGFGIYAGRYLRWNSWDLVVNPQGLAKDILDRVIHPFSHPRTWILTLLISVFLILGYAAIHQLTTLRTNKFDV